MISLQSKFVQRTARLIFLLAILQLGTFRCAAATPDAGQVGSLNWDASPDTSVVGYAIYYGTNSGNYTTRIDAGTNTAELIPGLVPGTKYYFIVTAYNAAAVESTPSNEIAITAPTLLQLTMGTTPSAGLTLGFTAVTGHWYELQATPDLQNWTTLWQSSVAAQTSWTTYQDVPQGNIPPQRFYRLIVH
jgi:Fibronectin type III domain